MNKAIRWLLALILVVALCAMAWSQVFRQPAASVQAQVIGLSPTPSTSDFTHVEGPPQIAFPQAFGPHPDFQTEWWYYTGNLQSQDGRRFGFQLTFFRRAVMPEQDWQARQSDWATNQIYMAHFTITDVAAQQFHYFERFERGAAGLAGATVDPNFEVWLNDWSVQQTAANTYRLRASEGSTAIDLTLVDRKGPILQGDQGYSQKGPQKGNASIYFSQTHLESQGSVTLAGKSYSVSGLSWMDREISTSALSKGPVGWDWFALHLNDGSELMAYVLRRSDGSVDTFSNGTLVRPDGTTVHLKRDDFQVIPDGTWKSPHSGGVYPARWTLRVPGQTLDLQIQPLLADQELNVSFVYWEGAVQISGTSGGRPVAGQGYVEMTGYTKSMEGTL